MWSGTCKGEGKRGPLMPSGAHKGGCLLYAVAGLLILMLLYLSIYTTDSFPPQTTLLRFTGFEFTSLAFHLEMEETHLEHMRTSHEPRRACESGESKMFFGPGGPSPCPNLFRAVRFGTRRGVQDGPFAIAAAACWDTLRDDAKDLSSSSSAAASGDVGREPAAVRVGRGLGELRTGGSVGGITPSSYYTVYTPEEACDIVSSFSGVFLIGDSLIRHVAQALFVVLSGDPKSGAMRWWENDNKLASCHEDHQFMEKECRPLTLTSTTQFPSTPTTVLSRYCPRHNFTLSYLGFVHLPGRFRKRADQLVKNQRQLHRLLSRYYSVNPVVIFSPSALHWGLNVTQARSTVLKLHRTIQTATTGAVEILAPLHTQDGSRRYRNYRWQDLERAVQVVDGLRSFVDGGGLDEAHEGKGGAAVSSIEVFDTVNMTRNCKSFDGVHFTLGVNVLKAQLLLNRLDQIRRTRKLMPRCR